MYKRQANALQNIILPGVYHQRGPAPELRERAVALVEEMQVDCELELLPAYLRKDQRFRIAVARAMLLEPRALLLDNPFSPLDLTASNSFKRFLLNRVRKHGLLLMLVSYDIKFALQHSDQIIFTTEDHVYLFNAANDIQSCDVPEIRQFLDTEI